MPNPPEPDRGTPREPGAEPAGVPDDEQVDEATEAYPLVPPDPETETVVIDKPDLGTDPEADPEGQQRERRFTAPGFDAKETAIIATTPEPATEVFSTAPGRWASRADRPAGAAPNASETCCAAIYPRT